MFSLLRTSFFFLQKIWAHLCEHYFSPDPYNFHNILFFAAVVCSRQQLSEFSWVLVRSQYIYLFYEYILRVRGSVCVCVCVAGVRAMRMGKNMDHGPPNHILVYDSDVIKERLSVAGSDMTFHMIIILCGPEIDLHQRSMCLIGIWLSAHTQKFKSYFIPLDVCRNWIEKSFPTCFIFISPSQTIFSFPVLVQFWLMHWILFRMKWDIPFLFNFLVLVAIAIWCVHWRRWDFPPKTSLFSVDENGGAENKNGIYEQRE